LAHDQVIAAMYSDHVVKFAKDALLIDVRRWRVLLNTTLGGSSTPPAAAWSWLSRYSSRVPAGPVPLAARGLAAVLARAGPAGTVPSGSLLTVSVCPLFTVVVPSSCSVLAYLAECGRGSAR
jgi:hypothetical protein